jgi:hypothetical protein
MEPQFSAIAIRRAGLRAHRPRSQDGNAEQPFADFCISDQNLYPAARPMMLLAAGELKTGELIKCRYSSENNK